MTSALRALAAFALTSALACAACKIDPFTRPVRLANRTDDARLEGFDAGGASAEHIRLLAGGHEHLDDYVVLGVVFGGATDGIGEHADHVFELRTAAASLGADTVLDVHVEGRLLTGLAVKRRERSMKTDGGAT